MNGSRVMDGFVGRKVVWLVIAVALLIALVATPIALAARSSTPHLHAAPAKVIAFDRQMHKLWEDHVTWTRMVIVSFAAGLDDYNTAVDRLLQNQVDIGNAIKPFYGEAAGNQLTQLLHDHIVIAADLLKAAKAGDATAIKNASDRWYANADAIAAFLNNANPKYWPLAEMKQMMHTHLDLTFQEASARLNGEWTTDVSAYDAVHNEILAMADMLSEGIVRQFPSKFN